jgi:hypothetical protein
MTVKEEKVKSMFPPLGHNEALENFFLSYILVLHSFFLRHFKSF